MPHLHIEEFKTLEFPCLQNDVRFNFIADNANHENEKLISVAVDEDEFFLLVKEEQNRTLLKTDKLTRPASIYNVHRALLAYADIAQLKIISSNVPENSKNIHLQEVTALKSIEWFVSDFPTDREVRIEVGFGSGRHLLHQAQNNPDITFIGIEIHKPSVEQVLKQINILGLKNLILLDYDARLFLELVPSNIVSRIYVHFPVPWDKKPHRRVISTDFISESTRVLAPQGRLELRTDSENYFEYSWQTFIALNRARLEVNKNQEIAISSKYEDRWKKQEKNIYDITLTIDEISDERKIEGSFAFSSTLDMERLRALNGTTEKIEGGFIHFERLYVTNDSRALVRLSMGSFERPEHLFVLIAKDKTSYFPTEPVASRINFITHKHLDGLLHG